MAMKPFIFLSLLLSVGLSSWLVSCTDKQPDPDTGTLQLTFDNVVGNQDLQLTTGAYTNATGEKFSVTLLNYFVSNIRLQRADGTTYTVPQDSSCFLIRESDPASQTIALNHIPTGAYTGVSYLIGVDSLRSTMDISRRKGVLEPGGGHNGGVVLGTGTRAISFLSSKGLPPRWPLIQRAKNDFNITSGCLGDMTPKPSITCVRLACP